MAATVANRHRQKGEKRYKPEDFMPKVKRTQSPEEMLAYVEQLNALFGGKDLRKQR